MTIPALPDAPLPSDSPATFNSKAFAFLAALDDWGTAANALGSEVNDDANTASAAAGTATTQAGIATTKAAEAAASANSALTAPGTSATSTTSLTIGVSSKSLTIQSGKAYAVGMSIIVAVTADPSKRMSGYIESYNPSTGALNVYVQTTQGSGTYADWTVSLGGITATLPADATQAEMEAGTEAGSRTMSPLRVGQAIAALAQAKVGRVAMSSNYTLQATDRSKLIDFVGTSDATLDFPSAATLGDGWACWLRNSSDSDLLMGAEVVGAEQITNGNLSTDIVGADVVVNGNFATGNDWTSSAGWNISAGVATATSAQNLTANVDPLVVGTWYLVTYTVVTRTAGTVNIRFGETIGTGRTTTGTFTEILQCVGTPSLRIQGNGTFSGSVDNVIVRPYNAGWVVGGNVLANPRFDNNGEGWVVSDTNAAVTFATNAATFSAGSDPTLTLAGYTDNSTAYRVSFTVSNYVSGDVTPSIHGTAGTAVSANGNYVQYITSGTALASGFRFTGASSFRGTISNVVISRRVEFSAVPVTYDAANGELDFAALTVDTVAGPEQNISALVSGGIYELTYQVKNWSAGGVAARFGVQTLTTRSANGTYTERFVANAAWSRIQFVARSAAFTGSIDNISVKRITASATAPDTDVTTAPWRMYSGEVRLLQSDGTNLRTVVINPFYRVFTESDVFVKPPGYKLFNGLLWGGGASGARNDGVAFGGGGGMCAPILAPSTALPAISPITIGSGGAAITTGVASCNPGGNSTFLGITALGATVSFGGGYNTPSSPFGFVRGTATAATNQVIAYGFGGSPGGSGTAAVDSSSTLQISLYGGGGGGYSDSSAAARVGGRSIYGGNGGVAGYTTVAATAGTAPGGGGGGYSGTTLASGAGARGELRIWGTV